MIKRKKKLYKKYLNNQNKLQVTKPTLAIAKKFIRELYEQKLTFHFDDCAVDCLYKTNKITTLKKAKAIQKTVDEIYEANFDWGKHGCPIGYALYLEKEMQDPKPRS